MFAAMGLSAVVPVVHGVYLYGFEQMISLIGLPWLVLQGVLYLVGAVLYAVSLTLDVVPVYSLRALRGQSGPSGLINTDTSHRLVYPSVSIQATTTFEEARIRSFMFSWY